MFLEERFIWVMSSEAQVYHHLAVLVLSLYVPVLLVHLRAVCANVTGASQGSLPKYPHA